MGEDWYFLTVLGVLMALISFTMSFAVGRVVRGNPPTPTHPPAQEPGLQARSRDAGGGGVPPGAAGPGRALSLVLACWVTLGTSLGLRLRVCMVTRDQTVLSLSFMPPLPTAAAPPALVSAQ